MARRSFNFLVMILVFISLTGCDNPEKLQGDLVGQFPSPNRQVVALTTRYSGNATVSYVDRIYLKSVDDGHVHLILKADKADKIKVKWVGNRHLQIDIPCAQIFSYTNFFYRMKDGGLVYPVSIELMNRGLCVTHG